MGTLLQSRPVTSKIIAPWWFNNPPWITMTELSSSFCYLSHFSPGTPIPPILSSILSTPSNMLTTWLITLLVLPMAFARKRGSSKHTVPSVKMFPLPLVSLTRGFGSSDSRKLLNNRSSEAVGGSDIYHLLQLSRPFLVIGQISLSSIFMTHCLLLPLLNICPLVPDPSTATKALPPHCTIQHSQQQHAAKGFGWDFFQFV